MTTFVTIQTSIADYLQRTDLTSQIKTAINRAISTYSTHDFWFTQAKGASFNTVNGQESYTTADGVPSDIREIDYLKMTVGTSYYRMKMRTIQFIEDRNPNNSVGRPSDFAYYNGKIYFNPVPSGAYAMTMWYRKNYVDLSADSDTNDFTTNEEALNLIEARALVWLNSFVIRDPIGAAEAEKEEAKALAVLTTISSNIQFTEEISPTDF